MAFDAYVAIQSCGCITAWCSDRADEDTARFVSEQIKRGLTIERVNTDEVKTRPEFAPDECPHNPKGWERPAPPDPDEARIKWTRVGSRGVSRAYVKHRYHHSWSAGEVAKRDGKWWATPGWFNSSTSTEANDGRGDEAGPEEVAGPFDTQKAAGQWLVDRAIPEINAQARKRHEEMIARGPDPHSGTVPTVTRAGLPIPPFKPGEIWQWTWGSGRRIRILQEPDKSPRGGVFVLAEDVDRDDSEPENLLRQPWTHIDESCFPSLVLAFTSEGQS